MLAALVPAGLNAQAATGTIEGRVTEQGTGRPLAGAQVFVAGTTVGTVSAANGTYRVLGVPARTVEVRARLIGFAPMNRQAAVTAGQTATVNFEMAVSALQLEQVVVTGSGQAVEVKKLGNTVATVQVPQFTPISSPSDLLLGREPGLVGLPSSGLTGEGARIRIRGNASLSMSNEPIVFVDGIRINSKGDFGPNVGAGGGGVPSRLDDIDPNSIERVEILKGAAAATLYGTEASNGVIQIFTKKGQSGAPRWNVQVEQAAINYEKDRVKQAFGFAGNSNSCTGANLVGGLCTAAGAQAHAARLSQFYGRTIQPYEILTSDWPTRLMGTGMGTTAAATVDGGTDRYTYFVSGRYAFENGPMQGEEIGPVRDVNRRISGTLNTGLVATNQLRLNFRAGFTDTHQETPGNNNNIYAVTALSMFGKPELANCGASSVASPGVCTGAGNTAGNAAFMTVRESLQGLTQQDAGRFTGVFEAQYAAMSNLNFTGTFGIDATDQRDFNFRAFGHNIDQFTGLNNNGERAYDAIRDRQYTVDVKGSWNWRPASIVTSDLVMGIQGFIERVNQIGGFNSNFPGPGLEVVGAGSSPSINEQFLSTVNGGFFAQDQLSFKDWIHTTIGARYDYSSAFGEEAGGVLYPKASISVVPSDLSGWGSPLGINTFRVRAAIGKSGRQPGAFDKFTTYQPIATPIGSGLVPANLGNPNLKPEVSTEIEAGFEVGLWDNKLGLDVTYWDRSVEDVLVSKQFPLSGGFQLRQLANIGELAANGYDVSLKAFVLNTPRYALDLFANTAYIKQEVVSLGGAPPIKVGGSYPRYRNFIIAGMPPGALLGAKLIQSCALRPSGATYTCLAAGELPYDTNGDGRPDTEAQLRAYLSQARTLNNLNPIMVDEDGDRDLLDHFDGKPYPDFQGAFGANLTMFRNWKLATLFEYRQGDYTVTNLTDAFRNANPLIGRNTKAAAEAEMAVENPGSTVDQRLEAAKAWTKLKALSPYDGLNQGEDGAFVRWRELSLTYTAPTDLAARLGVKSIAVTGSGRNLFLWTKYSGTDPEVNAIGRTSGGGRDENFLDAVDAFGWPIARRFAINVRLGF
ncbi:MAG TPA: SusC/RagA family TonB-linked outer membrane protein [Gemmatimonadaceae bacterium]|nr:SusC/RagA family TonB-linked outer membrane protein [Gemmatimonadaceae bacterium]